MGKKLYIGNLSFSVDSAEIEQLFAQEGTVESVNIIMDRSTGRSKGFGFVVMANDGEATACIDRFNGFEHSGRQLKVSEAKPEAPREERSSYGGGGGRGGGGGGRRGGGGW